MSTVIERGEEAGLVLPAASIEVAVMPCVPWVRDELVTVQLPFASATALPIWIEPANTMTVLPEAAVPMKVGVLLLVTLSLFSEPVSESAVMSGVEGGPAAVESAGRYA